LPHVRMAYHAVWWSSIAVAVTAHLVSCGTWAHRRI